LLRVAKLDLKVEYRRVFLGRNLVIAAKRKNRRNDEITATEVRLIGSDGEQVGIVGLDEAKEKAEGEGLDLVEIVPNAEPPVCRIMDYGKHVFEQKKQQQAAKKKQKQVQVKEMKFRPGTGEGDYQVKLRNLVRFLEDGDKTKVTMRFRGREHAHRELGLELLERVEQDLSAYGEVEQKPQMEGRQMVMVMRPKK
jgi:translation initiation factor IF-3